MCGITGFWKDGAPPSKDVVLAMASRMHSRGPDDQGAWIDDTNGLALAHRRLSVIDLSPAGHQPMTSQCGRYVLVFNGEIYNHLDLRGELDSKERKIPWRSHSDTETLLTSICHWGIHPTLERLNGMFAFALWDSHECTLTLARDRMGEKPLYYGHNNETFIFGSELKAFKAFPSWEAEIDRDALSLFLRHNCVPAPWSIFKGISKLPPAHYVVIREAGQGVSEPVCYWNLGKIAEEGAGHSSGQAAELTEDLATLLKDAVGKRMAADVPLGAFLSGGYDSTIVAALMQAQSERPIKTFSIGSYDEGYNEAKHAKAVAECLGTDHTELYITPEQAMDVIPKLPTIYDEPFSDSSQIPTYLVSKLARRDVTVSLSGDGGDELFGGYNRHIVGPGIWSKVEHLPYRVRHRIGISINWLAQADLDKFTRLLPKRARIPGLSQKLEKLGSALNARDGVGFYRDLASHWKRPDKVVIGATEPETLLSKTNCLPKLPGLREQMMYLDMMTYLPDDILTKVDRASMAVSLEARVPLLDHRLVEFAWRVPTKYKVRNGQGKWLLRQVLYKYVPQEFMDRPKMGFAVPIGQWLRGPLRDWAEDLIDETRLRDEGFFDPNPIRHMWEEHLSGKRQWEYHLWDILMFQAWWRSQ